MINKFKDFLKSKLKRSSAHDEDHFEDDIHQDDLTIDEEEHYQELEQEVQREVVDEEIYTQVESEPLLKVEATHITKNPLSFLKELKPKKTWSKNEKSDGLKINFSISPSLAKLTDKTLSKSSREQIHQVSLIIIIATITYCAGKITALALKGTPKLHSQRQFVINVPFEKDFNTASLGQVRSINIFRTNAGLGKKNNKVADTKCIEAKQPSRLPIKLINTIVLQDSIKSLASVSIQGNRLLREFREGEQIDNLAKIFKITRLSILVKNLENGVCESISSDKQKEMEAPFRVLSPSQSREFLRSKKMAGIENDGNKFNISKNVLDEKLKDIANILTQAKALKIQNPDGSISFKLTEMDPQGIFPFLGLQDQDIITSINGRPIYDMNEVMGLFAKIKNLSNLQLGVKRDGTDSVQEYSIKK